MAFDDATRRMHLFQEHGNQLSSKVDVAMQGIIVIEQGMGEMETKATNKPEGALNGDKSKFRQWHQKLMNAMSQVKREYGEIIKTREREMGTGTKSEEVMENIMTKFKNYGEFSEALYCVLMDKAEGDAYDKMRPIGENEGITGYSTLYKWYTEISGLGLTEQTRRLMHPEAPKKQEDLADAVDTWVERVKRLEAHGDKYALPALYKVTALRLLMVGTSKDHFELWGAEYQNYDDGGYKEILGKAKDYARRRKLDHAATKAADPLDIGGVDGKPSNEGWANEWGKWQSPEIDSVMTGKGKGKGFR